MTNNEAVDRIYKFIDMDKLQNFSQKNLYDGLSGISIFLYWYFKVMNVSSAEIKASYAIEQCWGRHLLDMPSNFYWGNSGVIWGLEWLKNNKLIDFETADSTLNEIDTCIIRQRIYSPLQIDIENSFFSAGIYLFARYKSYSCYNKEQRTDNTILYELYLREHIIYLIDECNRILTGKSYLQSLFLKGITPELLISILFFIKTTHREFFFPSETTNLIQIILKLVKKPLEIRCYNIVDVITLQHLLNNKSEIDETVFQSIKGYKDLFFLLSKAGFNSLLYDDPTIFDNVLEVCIKYHRTFCSTFFSGLKRNSLDYPLSMNGLSGIGYGLLNSTITLENYF